MLMEAHEIHVDRPQGVFFLTLQNNTRHPQQNEMIRDRWVGWSWGWHKMIHHGLIHSLVTFSPNVSEQFYTLPWYAGSRPQPHSQESKRQRHRWLPLRAHAAAQYFHRDASPSLQAQTNMSPAESVQQMSLKSCLEASFHVLTQTQSCQMTTGCSNRESALW